MQNIFGSQRSSYTIRTPCALKGPQTVTVESKSRDHGTSANDFVVTFKQPIKCDVNQCLGFYLKEAQLPVASWTVNQGYDTFQLGFSGYADGDADKKVYDVKLKHGQFTADEFANMVTDALNNTMFIDDAGASIHILHLHSFNPTPPSAAMIAKVNAAITSYNATTPANGGNPMATGVPTTNDGDINSPVTFKCEYTDQNRFIIRRTDPGRLYQTGEFVIAIKHYQLAKAFGAPWNALGIDKTNRSRFTKTDILEAETFYLPRYESNWSTRPTPLDDTGTWTGQSQGKTFRHSHQYFLLRSSRWLSSTRARVGVNVYNAPYNDTDDLNQADPAISTTSHDVYGDDWFSQALVMPYSSRIRGDDCYYIRSSLFGNNTIQTNNNSAGSDLLQMVRIQRTLGEVEFWSPTYTPEPHIISRRDIPSLRFTIHDKDNHLVEFNGEEILLEIEFITYDIVTLPIIQPGGNERFVAPHNYAPDYTSRVLPQPVTGGSHLPSGFGNYRM